MDFVKCQCVNPNFSDTLDVADDSHARDHRISAPGEVGTVGPRVEVLVLFVPHGARRRARHGAGQTHVACEHQMRALLGLRVWTGSVEACFTRVQPSPAD